MTRAIAVAENVNGSYNVGSFFQRKELYVALALVGLVVHMGFARPIYDWHDRIGAWIPLILLLTLLYRYVCQATKRFPVLLLVALQIYVFYSVPQFTQEVLRLYWGIYEPAPAAITSAVFLVIAGEISFLLGYGLYQRLAAGRISVFDRILPRPSPNWTRVLPLYAIPSLIILSLNSLRRDAIPIDVRFPLTQLFNAYLALVLMLYLGHRFRLKRMRVMAFVYIVLMSIVGFVQGSTGNILNPVIIAVVAAWIWGNGIRKRWIVGIVAAIVIINPVKNEFRNLEASDTEVASLARVGQRLGTWKVAFANIWIENPTDSNVLDTASRFSDLLSFAQAVDYVPSVVPYNHGDGMGITLIYWIPRILWPSKPASTDLLYNRYAVEFGYTTYDGTLTSTTGASAYTEGYWNFGGTGVILILFALGFCLAVCFANEGLRGDASTIACLVYLASVLLLVQPLSLTASSLITFSVGMWCAMHGLQRLSGGHLHRSEGQTVRMRPLARAARSHHLQR